MFPAVINPFAYRPCRGKPTGEPRPVAERVFMDNVDRLINKPARWFGMVPAWIVDYADIIGGSGIAVFTVLCIHASKVKRCFPSIPTIAKESGFSETTVKEAIKGLVGTGLIRIIAPGNGRGHANIYEIVDILERGQPATALQIKGSAADDKGVGKEEERGRQATTNISNNISIEQKNKNYLFPSPLTDEEINRNRTALDKLRLQIKGQL